MKTLPPKAGVDKRRAEYERLRDRGLSRVAAAAAAGVGERTGFRYDRRRRQELGAPSPHRPAGWMRGPILDHLRKYPHLVFGPTDLARVIAGTDRASGTASDAVSSLVDEGLAEVVMERLGKRLVRRYRLAAASELREAA